MEIRKTAMGVLSFSESGILCQLPAEVQTCADLRALLILVGQQQHDKGISLINATLASSFQPITQREGYPVMKDI